MSAEFSTPNAAGRTQESVRQELLSRLLAADTTAHAERVVRELRAEGLISGDDISGDISSDNTVDVFVFEPDTPGDPVERSIALRLRLAADDPTRTWFTIAGFLTTILAVGTPQTSAADTANIVADAVAAVYAARPAIGSAGTQLPISQAAQGFQQARRALTLAQIGAADSQVTRWATLGSWKALALLAEAYGPAQLTDLVHPGLAGLISAGRDDLIHTLAAYLANGGDARRTAEDLDLHRSSLYYRLDRLDDALGGDLSSGEARFELMLSLRLAQFAGQYRMRSGRKRRPSGS